MRYDRMGRARVTPKFLDSFFFESGLSPFPLPERKCLVLHDSRMKRAGKKSCKPIYLIRINQPKKQGKITKFL
uniref:Uncharacterized protein n=1 Tax=Arundo donax TaxID=35708 RepID=A0A0A8XNR2_ARUDO